MSGAGGIQQIPFEVFPNVSKEFVKLNEKFHNDIPLEIRTVLEEKLLISGFIKQHLVKPVSLKEISSAIQVSLQ